MAELLPIKVVSTLNQAQITQAKQNASAIAAVGLTTPASTTDRFTFFAAFDGTRNNRDNLTRFNDIQNTNVAQLEIKVKAAIGGNSNFDSQYYAGIGSDGSVIAAGPLPTAQALAIAEQAYLDFNESASNWVKNEEWGPKNGVRSCKATYSLVNS